MLQQQTGEMGRSNLSDTTASTDIVEDGIASLYDTDVLERIEGSVQLLLGTICSGSTDREGLRDTPKASQLPCRFSALKVVFWR